VTEPSPERPSSLPTVRYKGEDLDPERGPGLGCFWFQMIVLGVLLVLTPLSVSLGAPSVLSAILLFLTIGILLVSGQTIIFLLRLVAADRREGRRRPMASGTRTVGELEDATPGSGAPTGSAIDRPGPAASDATTDDSGGTARPGSAEPARPGSAEPAPSPSSDAAPSTSSDEGPVRQ